MSAALPAINRGLIARLSAAVFDKEDTEEVRLRKTVLLVAAALMNVAAALWTAIVFGMGLPLPNTLPLAYPVVTALLVLYFVVSRDFAGYRLGQLLLLLFVPFVLQWSIGGFVSASGVVLLALLAPIGALVVYGHRAALPWFAAYGVLVAVSGGMDFVLTSGEVRGIPLQSIAVFFVVNFSIMSTVVFVILWYFVRQNEVYRLDAAEQHAQMRGERGRAQALIDSMLPRHVAERLKGEQGALADSYEEVSVMFADLSNFTEFASRVQPADLVDFLNDVFTRLDDLSARFRLDKIKTIGDAYMVVGGLSADAGSPVSAVAEMALAVREMARTDALFQRYGTQFHVGIATGPAVAAVIGTRRLSYDVWGDTVNMAARMTSEAPAGTIEVDVNTFRRLSPFYEFAAPRRAALKGKGVVTVYPLLGRLASARRRF